MDSYGKNKEVKQLETMYSFGCNMNSISYLQLGMPLVISHIKSHYEHILLTIVKH